MNWHARTLFSLQKGLHILQKNFLQFLYFVEQTCSAQTTSPVHISSAHMNLVTQRSNEAKRLDGMSMFANNALLGGGVRVWIREQRKIKRTNALLCLWCQTWTSLETSLCNNSWVSLLFGSHCIYESIRTATIGEKLACWTKSFGLSLVGLLTFI